MSDYQPKGCGFDTQLGSYILLRDIPSTSVPKREVTRYLHKTRWYWLYQPVDTKNLPILRLRLRTLCLGGHVLFLLCLKRVGCLTKPKTADTSSKTVNLCITVVQPLQRSCVAYRIVKFSSNIDAVF